MRQQTLGTLAFVVSLIVVIFTAGAADSETDSQNEVLYYRHPMNPTITSDQPMQDEMGMDYVAVYANGDPGGSTVTISPVVMQNMGVRSAPVARGDLPRRIRTVGYVDFDEDRLSHVHLRTDGWIEELYVKSEGERVARGDVLFELYSPTLVNAQEEYLDARASGSKNLQRASRERLRALGVTPGQIEQLAASGKARQRLSMYAPQSGIVAVLNVRDGMYVKPATEIMTLADLSSVWLLAEVFERQADWVRVGQDATVTLPYLPGRSWSGKVEYIYPSLDPKTRTLRVRLRFANPEEDLKPNMFADVTIDAAGKKDVLKIPVESVIRTGHENRVVVDLGEGRFASRPVQTGIESGGWVEVLDGLEEDEMVVVSGQFLIDSEASLKASFTRMQNSAEPGPDAHHRHH